MDVKPRISGKDATNVAMEAEKYGPVRITASDSSALSSNADEQLTQLPATVEVALDGQRRKMPPRVRKPSPLHDQCLAPTPDLTGHHARLREAFGNTKTVEVQHVHLHSGAQGVVGIVNAAGEDHATREGQK
jgi:hypothetical protein